VLTDPPALAPAPSLPPSSASADAGSTPESLEPSASPSLDLDPGAFAAQKTVARLRVALVAVSALSALLVVALLVSVATRPSAAPAPVASAAPPASEAVPPPPPEPPVVPKGCTLAAPAAKLAPTIERSILPHLTSLPDGRVAIGFASTRTRGAGIVVDPRTLDKEVISEERGGRRVRDVVLASASPLSFVVNRDKGPLDATRSLAGAPNTVLGFSRSGISRSVDGGDLELLWKVERDKVTEPRSASAGAAGSVVAFRRGGLGGEILLGWLGRDGMPTGSLEAVPAGVRYVGTPAPAASASGVAVAFAGRNDEDEDWGIRLAFGALGTIPKRVTDFRVPPGGPGGGAIAPALAPLGDGWLLQWTEGGPGNYQVRVQRLGADSEPLGDPVLTSPKGASAGQGALWVSGTRALSVYVLTVSGYDELWGAAVECP